MKRCDLLKSVGLAGILAMALFKRVSGAARDSRPTVMELRHLPQSDDPGTPRDSKAVVKVIGIGGAGGNTLDRMIREGMTGVEFIAANTNAQALGRSMAPRKLTLGKIELGAGARPEVGRDAAIDARHWIAEMLEDARMLFIVAGMGGGTGTGAAPVIARIAREMGIPAIIAMVTWPFAFEGQRRIRNTEAGIVKLQKYVDSLIIFPNDRLTETLGDDVSIGDAFNVSDDRLCRVIKGIADHAQRKAI
jgi:cell division protein FtsZ